MESKARVFFRGSAIFQRSMGNKNSAFETKLKAKAGDFFLPSIFAGKRFVLGVHWKALYTVIYIYTFSWVFVEVGVDGPLLYC